ncbi:hypothetical protein [Tsukamurella serpentis]
MSGQFQQGPVWPGPGPQPPTWPAPPPPPKPERGPRPPDLTLSVQLWAFVLVASVISRVAQAVSGRGSEEVRQQFEADRRGDGFMARTMREAYPDFQSFDTAIFYTALMMTTFGALVAAVLVYLMWRGQSWARVLLQFAAAFVLVQGVFGFFSGEALIAVPAILAAVAVVGAMITANSREAQEFFKPGSKARV